MEKTTRSKSKATASEKKAPATGRKRKTEAVESSVSEEVKPKTTSSDSGTAWKTIRQPKVYLTLLGLIVLVTFGYLAYKNLVFAWVGTTPLTRLDLYHRMEKQSGKELSERMISEALVLNEAKKRNVTVSQDEINQQIGTIEQQQGGKDKLEEALTAQKMSRQDLETEIKFSKLIDKMFGSDVKIEDADIDAYMEQNKDQLGTVPADKNSSESALMRQQISETLKRQKVNQSFSDWLAEAQKSNDVKRL